MPLPKRAPGGPARIRTGQIWRATAGAGGDWSWPVVVVGRVKDAPNQLRVVPIVGEAWLATERDLILETEVLGYAAFADLHNVGTVVEEQFTEFLGTLDQTQAAELVGLYRSVLGTGAPPATARTGLPVVTRKDPRLLASQVRAEGLRDLWSIVDALVDADDDAAGEQVASASPLAELLSSRLQGPDADWDEPGLLEQTRADRKHVAGFLAGRVDLTDRRDVADLAKIIQVLEIDWDEARPAVAAALAASPGGRRYATTDDLPLAARSTPGSSQEEVTLHLFAESTSIDESPEARRSQAERYLQDLALALEDDA